MKKFVLKSVSIHDWKGMTRKVDLFDDHTYISGVNGIGKTTVMKAFFWSLTGYTDAVSGKNSDLFDNREELTPDTPEAVVEIVFTIDGNEHRLRRSAKAKFRRPKGSTEYVKDSSDTYQIMLDDMPYQSGEFDEWVSYNICDARTLRNVLSGDFFLSDAMDDRKKAREMLKGLVGDVSDDELTGDYSVIAEDLLQYTEQMIEERARKRMGDIRKRQAELPALISAKSEELASLNETDYDSIGEDIESVKKQIESIDGTILGRAESAKVAIQKQKEIMDSISDLMEKRRSLVMEYARKKNLAAGEYDSRISYAKSENRKKTEEHLAMKKRKERLSEKISHAHEVAASLEEMLESLREERDRILSSTFTGFTCSLCGQQLPSDMVESARETFSKNKKKQLDDLVTRAKSVKASIDENMSYASEMEAEMNAIPEAPELIDVKSIEREKYDAMSMYIPVEETDEYKAMTKAIEDEEKRIPDGNAYDSTALINMKKELLSRLEELNRTYGLKERAEVLSDSINALSDERRKCGVELARQEGIIAKCRERVHEKAEIVARKVNSRLMYSRIDTFDVQKDGQIIDSLVIRDRNGIRYETTNWTSRLLISVDMQRLFCNVIGIDMPVWIDEASSINAFNLPRYEGTQFIYMFCSDNKRLTISNNR